MKCRSSLVVLAALSWSVAFAAVAKASPPARNVEPNTLVPEGVVRYAPSLFPDRIVAVPAQDASTGFAVIWRTDASVRTPVLEIAIANDSPDQWRGDVPPRRLASDTVALAARNGLARHHRVVVDRLQPGTLYAWRGQGGNARSPWRQLRTAASTGTPLEFVYLGDTQSKNASLVLAGNPNPWSVVLIHQPFYSPRGEERNTRHQVLRDTLMPVLQKHAVNLVLQGRDHVYGRRSDAQAATPLYLMSVAGPKPYIVSDDARETMSPVGEDMQLFPVLRLEGHRLAYEARTVTGTLYDAFSIIDAGAAGRRVEEHVEGRAGERRCARSQTLGGRADRCRE